MADLAKTHVTAGRLPAAALHPGVSCSRLFLVVKNSNWLLILLKIGAEIVLPDSVFGTAVS
jgi:hypothetical protein